MKKIIFIFTLLLLYFNLESSPLRRPVNLGTFCEERNYDEPTNVDFIVYAAYDNLPIYKTENGVIEQRVGFLKRYVVMDYNNNKTWLRIGESSDVPIKSNSEIREIGWVRSEDVLLSSLCVRNQQTLISAKVLLKTKAEKYRDEINKDKIVEEIQLRNSFNQSAEQVYTFGVKTDFLYIFKTHTTSDGILWYLTAPKQAYYAFDIDKNKAKELKFGWISSDYAQKWDTRFALRTRHSEDRPYFHLYPDNNPIGVMSNDPLIFSPKHDLYDEEYAMIIDYKEEIDWNQYMFRYILIRQPQRPPQLDFDVMKIGFIKSIGTYKDSDKKIINELTPKQIQEYNKLTDTMTESLKKLNIVFVLDASYSMENLISSVKHIVREVINKKSSHIKINFSLVLYRDKQSESNETDSVIGNNITILNALEQVETEPKDSDNTSLTENVFSGIIEALNITQNQDGTNILIIAGDAGNKYEPDDKKPDDECDDRAINQYRTIIKEVSKTQTYLYAVKLSSYSETMSEKFKADFEQMFKDLSSKRKFLNMLEDADLKKESLDKLIELENNSEAISDYLLSLIDQQEKIQVQMRDRFKEIAERGQIETVIKKMDNYQATTRLIRYLEQKMEDESNKPETDKEVLDALNYNKKPYFLLAWAAFTDTNGRRTCDYDLFIKQNELTIMKQNINKIINNLQPENLSKLLANTTKLASNHNFSSFEDFITIYTGLPMLKEGNIFSDYSIRDFWNWEAIIEENNNEQRIQQIRDTLKELGKELSIIVRNIEHFIDENSMIEQEYYWFPEKLMP